MIDFKEIYYGLTNLGVKDSAITGLDVKYSVPTSKWILDTSFSLSNQIKSILGDWKEESRDCDDFAMSTMALMRLFHSYNNTSTALPVAYFQFFKEGMGWHAINLAFVDDKKIIFFEPQTGQLLNLTKNEIKSCSRVLI